MLIYALLCACVCSVFSHTTMVMVLTFCLAIGIAMYVQYILTKFGPLFPSQLFVCYNKSFFKCHS